MINLWEMALRWPEFYRRASEVGIGVLAQSTALLLLGLLTACVLRRRGPSVQSAVYKATLLAVVLCAALSVALTGRVAALWTLRLPAPESAPLVYTLPETLPVSSAVAQTTPHPIDLTTPTATPPDDVIGSESANAFTGEGTAWPYVIGVGIWAAGTIMLLAWLGFCQMHLFRLRQHAAPVREEAVVTLLGELCASRRIRPPLILAGPYIRSPFLAGFRRPAIFLPASYAQDFDVAALRAILAHEVAHLARRDCWWNLLARLSCAALWAQPLMWLLCRRMEEVGEAVCDQEALRQARSPHAYADCLLGLAERLLPSRMENAVGAGVVPFRSALGRRIQAILDVSCQNRPLSARMRLAFAFGAVLTAVGGIFLVSAAAAPGQDDSRPVASQKNEDRPATTAPAQKPSTLIGRVVDEQGRPAADVTIRAIHRTVYRLLAPGVAISPGVAVTDKEGNYRMTGLGPATVYDLYIVQEPIGKRVAPAIENVDVGEGEVIRVPNFVLQPGAVITGVVTDQLTGMPLEGVVVAADGPHRPTALVNRNQPPLISKTDARGRYTLHVAPGKNRVYVVQVIPARPSIDQIEAPVRLYQKELEVKKGGTYDLSFAVDRFMTVPAIVTGRVVYPNGRPAAGIHVFARLCLVAPSENGWQLMVTYEPFYMVREITSADGSYRLAGLTTGPYNVLIWDVSGQRVTAARENLKFQAGQTYRLPDFVLTRGAVIEGTVKDEATGKPLPGVTVMCYGPYRPRSSMWPATTKTDEKGRYVMHVVAGRCTVFLNRHGYEDQITRVNLKPGEKKSVSFRVKVKDFFFETE